MAIELKTSDPGCLPTAEQTLILRAALLSGPAAGEAALRWLPTANLDRLGKSARRLLPLLYDRLRAQEIDHAILPVLKGVKRHTWYNNRMLFHQAREVVRHLTNAGINVMAIKGAALTISYYRDYGARPMEDLDLMVPVTSAVDALAIFRECGWVSQLPCSADFLCERILDFRHALHQRNPAGRDIDLHWHLLPICTSRNADDDFWKASCVADFEGEQVRVPCPADHLLHIIVHGVGWDKISPIRWIPDALAVLRMSESLDWDRFTAQAQKHHLTAMILPSLRYLQSEYEAPIPAGVISALTGTRVSWFHNLEHRNLIIRRDSVASASVYHICRVARVTAGVPLRKKVRSISLALCSSMNLERRRQLPGYIWKKVRKKLAHRKEQTVRGS